VCFSQGGLLFGTLLNLEPREDMEYDDCLL
jgi:hypothetical protein